MRRISLQDGREGHFKTATPKDIPAIIKLYDTVYSGKYTLREAKDPETMKEKIENPNYFWTLAHLDERVIGSVIFAIDPVNKIGKAYAAAVLPEFRGQDVMRTMVQQGLERLTVRTRSCDVIYATTRTVSVAPQVVLEHLGFHPMGIFPNVRKVKSFETHGLEIFFRQAALKLRRPKPQLVAEVVDFFKIVRELLDLEESKECELEASDPRKMGSEILFEVDRDEKRLLKRFDQYQDQDLLDTVFFPFTEPNMNFVSQDGTCEIFVNFNEEDGHGVIVGYKIGNRDLRHILSWFCEAAAREGLKYIEYLVNAYRPDLQRIALDSRFLPCAYFPAMRFNELNQREDYIVFSRSFEHLDFMEMQLGPINRKFLDAFMKAWYEMLVRCQPDFDEEWRIS